MSILRLLIGGFLIAHGLVHSVLVVVPRPDDPSARPATFLTDRAWLLTSLGLGEAVVRSFTILLWMAATVGFVAAGLGFFGILVPQGWWRTIAVASSAFSLLLIVLYWHPWFVVGPLLDVGILVALLWAHWPPETLVGS